MNLNLNILNSKALERQIKAVDGRIAELQKELRALERVRTACRILLGEDMDLAAGQEPVAAPAPVPAPSGPAPAKKTRQAKAARQSSADVTSLSEDQLAEIENYLMERDTEAESEELLEALRDSEFPFDADKERFLELLRKHPERFHESGNGNWSVAGPSTSSASFEADEASADQ